MARGQFNILIVGGNGSGKTQLQCNISIDYLEGNPEKRVLFVLSDDDEEKVAGLTEIDRTEFDTFTGIKKHIIDDATDFEYIAKYYKAYKDEMGRRIQRRFNGLMCCDDLGGAMNRRPLDILKFFKKRRQPNVDFLWAFHGWHCEVPPGFYTYVTSIIIFRTSDNHESTMKHLPHDKRKGFEEAYFRVQKRSEIDPHYHEEFILKPLTI